MFKRCVSLLAIAGFLASQLALTPCAHGGASHAARRHAANLHFHWNADGQDDCSHAHAHRHHGGDESAAIEQATLLRSPIDCVDHDADAIYLPAGWSNVAPPKSLETLSAASAGKSFPLAALPVWDNSPGANQTVASAWRPPDAVLDASALYLTLRNLRI